jgi:hypothetical protein
MRDPRSLEAILGSKIVLGKPQATNPQGLADFPKPLVPDPQFVQTPHDGVAFLFYWEETAR